MNNFRISSFIIAIFLFASACSSSKQTSNSNSPSANQWKRSVRGTWTLNAVTPKNFPTGANVSNIFDEAPIACFIGSTWDLVANGKGTITFSTNGELCAPGASRSIFWSVFNGEGADNTQFQFKKLYPGEKAKNISEGYRLYFESADAQSLILSMPVNLSDAPHASLVFEFTKQQ